ncbi:MAG: HAD family hydrolase [Pseudomonadota bacterium]
MAELTTIAFDADDTLWQSEQFYVLTQESFAALLKDYAEPEDLSKRLLHAEKRNLGHYGFGIKGFVLSMIETAIEVTEARVPASVIEEILTTGREMLAHPVELLPRAGETLDILAGRFTILLITKGDLFDQERKVAQSGLAQLFDAVEIVTNKDTVTYQTLFARHGDGAEGSMMVGNSLRSDVVPAIEAGSWGVFVPHDLTWSLEHTDTPNQAPRFRQIDDLGALPDLVEAIANS